MKLLAHKIRKIWILRRKQEILSKIVVWAEAVRFLMPYAGRSLETWELEIARRVGVQQPEKIRIVMVKDMPSPVDPLLSNLGKQFGLGGAGARGLTLEYDIFIRDGHYSRRLLSHECRHVAQYENAANLFDFMDRYFSEVIKYGYENAPLELDAKAHEVSNIQIKGKN